MQTSALLNRKRYFSALLMTLVSLLFFLSCDEYEEEYSPKLADKPVLRVSANEVALNQKQQEETAFTLAWTPRK